MTPVHLTPKIVAEATLAGRFVKSPWLGNVELLQNDRVFTVVTYRCSDPIQFDRMCRELADYTLAHKPNVDVVMFQL